MFILASGHLLPRLAHRPVDVDVKPEPRLAEKLVANDYVADDEAAMELHALKRILVVVLRLSFACRRWLVEDLVAWAHADADKVLLAIAHEELAAGRQALVHARTLVMASSVV